MGAIIIFAKVLLYFSIIIFLIAHLICFILYGTYRFVKPLQNPRTQPEEVSYNEYLTGFRTNEDSKTDSVILLFGGATDIAYNTAALYSHSFKPKIYTMDYYGTQKSAGKINLTNMKKSAEDFYDSVRKMEPRKKLFVIGHSYGTGMAAYLASVRPCQALILVSTFRTSADLYNRFVPVYHGIFRHLVPDNIKICEYAKDTDCPVYILGSKKDWIFPAKLQKKVADCYDHASLILFEDVPHEDYLKGGEPVAVIQDILEEEGNIGTGLADTMEKKEV